MTQMWLMLIPVLLCVEAVCHDLQNREIPDHVSLRMLLTGLLATGLSWHTVSFTNAMLGVVIGFVFVFPFTLREGIGGGDLKLVAAIGAWLGVTGTVSLLFWSALSGMVAAIVTLLRRKQDFPYAPAILVGLAVAVLFPTALVQIIDVLRGS